MLEWLDYADCAGDDPLKWDLDHIESDDIQAYARSVCADCPVRRECAAHAIDDRHDVGEIFNEVSAAANLDDLGREPVVEDGLAVLSQSGVIRGGVALSGGDSLALLHEVAGREFHGLRECLGCGRVLYLDHTPHGNRPQGSVRRAKGGMCNSCAYGKGRGRYGKGAGRSPVSEVAALRGRGMKAKDVAEMMGLGVSTVHAYMRRYRNGET